MDLRSLMNTSDDGDRPRAAAAAAAASAGPPPGHPAHAQARAHASSQPLAPKQQQQQQPQQQHPHPHPHPQHQPHLQHQSHPQHQPPPQLPYQQQAPTTPSQATTAYAFRESAYSHALHSSPGKPPAPQEYAVHPQVTTPSYPPQSPYQTPGPYPGRTAPPPLQAGVAAPYADARSPQSASMSGPSPYRHTPTSSVSGPGGGYPFPPTGPPQEVASPVQRHQYPSPNAYPPRESYSHPSGATAPSPYTQQQQQQQQQQPPPPQHMPQTPPIGTPVSAHPYLHQRSQSTHSTPTPTSAHSQHPQQLHGQAYPHGSPVATAHPPPEYVRQLSQPPTPLGPPPTGPRQSSTAPTFAHPQSPYQQRLSASHLAQATPPPPPPRIPSSHSGHERRSLSQSERDRSVSVSPKTRIPSLPSSVGGHTDSEARPHPSVANMVEPERERATTPAKRKLADRDLSPRELERKEPRPPPAEVNGGPRLSRSPVIQRKRKIHTTPPIWAQAWNARENKRLKLANFELQKRGPPSINGKPEPAKQDSTSRHTSPEAARSTAPPVQEPPKPDSLLGPWEESILGTRPSEELSKTIADFLFKNVTLHPDSGEILGRGVQFEIEAKMGQLIDRDTNDRVERAIGSECVLHDTGRLAFRSSMTEAQHKGLNDFLNSMVVQTDPRNPNARGRVQIQYKHRREIDKFYELPNALQARLPGCVRSLLSGRRSIKVRVTYDQKTQQVLAKIVKARVADIHIHLPTCPLDCRISINLEMAWDGSVEELESMAVGHADKFPDRNKDRLSYKQNHYQIDLTQVTQTMPGPGNTHRIDKEHELEVELSPDIVIDQQRRAMRNEPHQYQQLVDAFVDNVRVLARKSREFVY
ncbi:MRNA-capping enzyme subunit beta [Colletotrichum shisoi]|uniref:mRNA-capping enzyme subunit beta n=1 Tax=Colletotrichum shisoi TaxID=2078593 RepID=A0A5Q4C458_9PEZI|nr:MRNA-capping enzyme subunit beta [Colletotrichum shisoi]